MKRLNGIFLPKRKHAEARKIEMIPLPKIVRIPMLMHMGSACKPIVSIGDRVYVGQTIGSPVDAHSVPIHSSVSGTVSAIADYTVLTGVQVPCVEIIPDGTQKLFPGCEPPVIENREQLIEAARESGCVGLGGSGYPTFEKLSVPQQISLLIVNGAECEPYLSGDCRQLIEHTGDVLGGIRLVMRFLKIKECRIGIEKTHPAALKQVAYASAADENIKVCPLPSYYPQGSEKIVIYHTSSKIVPDGKTAADIGVLVLNVSTLAFLFRYSKTGVPLTDRLVTVDGNAVKKPCNLLVPIGTPQRDLLSYAECSFEKVKQLISGGPMMGISLYSDEQPVIKQQNGLIALTKPFRSEPTPCIRCGRCVRSCPMKLMPVELAKAYQLRDLVQLQKLHIELCMNCGCCSYVCPAKRPLAEENQLAKRLVAESSIKEA